MPPVLHVILTALFLAFAVCLVIGSRRSAR